MDMYGKLKELEKRIEELEKAAVKPEVVEEPEAPKRKKP